MLGSSSGNFTCSSSCANKDFDTSLFTSELYLSKSKTELHKHKVIEKTSCTVLAVEYFNYAMHLIIVTYFLMLIVKRIVLITKQCTVQASKMNSNEKKV